ncbi:MAG: hypothetical protein HZA70_05635 [Planctomycetes bacterium]|nr:hypothetical protein [Planctomycetota bacterium]
MVKKVITKVDTASKAAEIAMGFVKKMVPPIKAEAAHLLSSKKVNSLWEVKIDVGIISYEGVILKINPKGDIEEYTTFFPSPLEPEV